MGWRMPKVCTAKHGVSRMPTLGPGGLRHASPASAPTSHPPAAAGAVPSAAPGVSRQAPRQLHHDRKGQHDEGAGKNAADQRQQHFHRRLQGHLLRPDPPVVAAMSASVRSTAPDLRPGPLPAPSPRPSGPPGCCRCAGPAAGSRPLAARRRASRPARGPARHAAGPADRCARPVAAPLHAHSGFHAQDHHVEHEGQAALDVARKAGCLPARAPHPSHRNASHVSQPAQPAATAVATSGGMSASEHGAAPHASILAMRRISTTPAVSSAASSASTPQPAGVRHSRLMIAGSSR